MLPFPHEIHLSMLLNESSAWDQEATGGQSWQIGRIQEQVLDAHHLSLARKARTTQPSCPGLSHWLEQGSAQAQNRQGPYFSS